MEDDLEDYDEDDGHVPTFTAELGKLKEKEMKELDIGDDE